MTRVILLNGPPGSGKDFCGELIDERLEARVHVDKFARELKEACHAAYGIFIAGKPAPHDWLESRKDRPCGELFGLTPRSVYIAFSEQYMKPMHGVDIFGQLLLRTLKIKACGAETIVITDSGFMEEAEPIVRHFEPGNVSLIQLHREGCSFKGDSRNYIDLLHLGIEPSIVENSGTADELWEQLEPLL